MIHQKILLKILHTKILHVTSQKWRHTLFSISRSQFENWKLVTLKAAFHFVRFVRRLIRTALARALHDNIWTQRSFFVFVSCALKVEKFQLFQRTIVALDVISLRNKSANTIIWLNVQKKFFVYERYFNICF